jgi:hypothetical protein
MRPLSVSRRNRYDITIDIDESTVPATDYNDFISAAKRWEQIIISDIDDVPVSEIDDEPTGAPGCSYPTGSIDDIYLCVSYKQLPKGIIGQGGYNYIRNTNQLPILGYVQLDPDEIERERSGGYLNDLILHEIGHAIGLGTTRGNCPATNTLSKANLEYQRISNCSTPIPMDRPPSCGHYSEACLGTELMTPSVMPGDSPISRITIGWLDDLGYDVNYTRADPFTSKQLGTIAGCNCNSQRQGQRNLWNYNNDNDRTNARSVGRRTNSTATTIADHHYTMRYHQQRPRTLSVDGYNAAIASGMAYLQEKRMERNRRTIEQPSSSSSSSVTYVGDQFVWVYVRENNQIHSVLVQP